MPIDPPPGRLCNCLAIRQAARHVTQFYDQCLAPTGLRATQFAVLSRLHRLGPMTINALARELVMDRTTLGRNILPLEREGLVEDRTRPHRPPPQGVAGHRGRRGTGAASRCSAGPRRRPGSRPRSAPERAAELRAMMRAVAATDLPAPGVPRA